MRTAGQGPGGFEKRDGFIKPGQDLGNHSILRLDTHCSLTY